MLPRRLASKPSRQLLWLWLEKDMKHLQGEIGLDAACGLFENKRFFRTKRYIGVDANQERIETGLKRHPDAEGEAIKIEDLGERHAADIVLCVQVIGTDVKFESENALKAVKKLIQVTRPGGALIVNIGSKSPTNGIVAALRAAFEYVEVRRYGRRMASFPVPLPQIIAHLMNRFQSLRGDNKVYCLCKGKQGARNGTPRH